MRACVLFFGCFLPCWLLGQYATNFDDWPIIAEGDWEQTWPEGTYRSYGCYCNFGNTLSGLRKIGFNQAGDIFELPAVSYPQRIRFQARTSTGSDAELSVQYLEEGVWTDAGRCPILGEAYRPCTVELGIPEAQVPLRIVMTRLGNSVFIDDLEVFTALLPVELAAFTARPGEQGEVLLEWQTASETGNAWFEVQRSADGESFEPVGRVPGAGFSTTSQEYNFSDKPGQVGLWYYRLEQKDFDGSAMRSNVVSVRLESGPRPLRVFPAVAADILTVALTPRDSPGRLFIMDGIGRIVEEQVLAPGTGETRIAVGHLARGRYFLVVRGRMWLQRGSFVKG